LFREQRLLSEVLTVLREAMPFTLRGFDTDNDTVFINATVKDWCDGGDIAFTRSRPYRKNDQASYARFWVTLPDQAARVSVSRASTPSVNVTPSMTRGNWFAPLRRRHVLAAA